MKKNLQSQEELAQELHNSISKINPQVFDAVANLHSKIPTIDPILLGSIQRMAEQFNQIDPVILRILENDSFKSFVENINSTQLDGLSVNDEDFENLINQIQIDNNTEAIEKQIAQNPILILIFAFLIAFFQQTGSNMSDIFVKPQLEKLENILENNMEEIRVITDIVNLREAPKGTAKSLLKLEIDHTITVLSKSGNWFKIRYHYDTNEYIEGWVFKRYTKKIGDAELK